MAENPKVFFSKSFEPSQDDMLILRFLESKLVPLVNNFLLCGYTKSAIADGLIAAINIWRNKP